MVSRRDNSYINPYRLFSAHAGKCLIPENTDNFALRLGAYRLPRPIIMYLHWLALTYQSWGRHRGFCFSPNSSGLHPIWIHCSAIQHNKRRTCSGGTFGAVVANTSLPAPGRASNQNGLSVGATLSSALRSCFMAKEEPIISGVSPVRFFSNSFSFAAAMSQLRV